MARYYFDLFDGDTLWDFQGTELPTLDRARREAMRAATDVARDMFQADGSSRRIAVQVRGESGSILATAQVDVVIREGE